ncbi:hypothetical protein MUG94_13320 [Arthrobacter gengyunqii]|uniref:Uncharacterized protein n=1 Tax=Arthrobacter gengyunqii TaxID=2886940 RepID=A0A9X1LZG8_9MICC|nr:hypothetical protein [Arthrobacter gengyunqii]MCC3268095.1 hypothetical protein [Arthrobacter gengyunqii]UOY95513.1 hypothetical protein MUG94_13320 [Arthrobacter gengyunqii]
MRTFGSAILGFAAVLLAVAALCSAWLAVNVVSEDGFVSLGQPLGTNEAFQQDLAEELGAQVTNSVQLPDAVASFVQPLITSAVQGVQSLPGYPQAWDETLQRSHAQTFDGDGGVTLDLAPVVGLVTNELGSAAGTDVQAPEQSLLELGGADQRSEIELAVKAANAWPFLALGAGIAAVLALLVARSRGAALAWMGAGALLGGGALWFAAGSLPSFAARPAYYSALAETFAAAFAAEAGPSLQAWMIPFLLGAAVILVLGLLIRAVGGRRARR